MQFGETLPISTQYNPVFNPVRPMRFDRNVRRNPYLNRSDQFRLLRLVGLIGLVIVLIQLAARPSSWNWFFAFSEQESQQVESKPDFGGKLVPLDIKRPREAAALPEDAFYARVEEDTDVVPNDEGLAGPPTPGHVLPETMFEGVEDDWFGPTRTEQPALVRLAKYLDGVDAAALDTAASREATFDSLTGRPEYFRGRPVALAGRLRRFVQGRIGSGDETRDVWEAWVIASDSHNTPYLVYCLAPPASMPTGEGLDEAVRFNAYAVRRYAYRSIGGESVTTMLMAPTLKWTPPVPAATEQINDELQWGAIVGFVGILLVLMVIGGWYLASDRRFRRSRLHAIGESRLDAAPEDLNSLADLDGGDPHQIRIDESAEVAGKP